MTPKATDAFMAAARLLDVKAARAIIVQYHPGKADLSDNELVAVLHVARLTDPFCGQIPRRISLDYLKANNITLGESEAELWK